MFDENFTNAPKTHLTTCIPFDPKWQLELEEEDLEAQIAAIPDTFDVQKIIKNIENKIN